MVACHCLGDCCWTLLPKQPTRGVQSMAIFTVATGRTLPSLLCLQSLGETVKNSALEPQMDLSGDSKTL